MRQGSKRLGKGLLTVLPIIVAVLVVVYMVKHRPGPSLKEEVESVRTLRVIEALSVDLVPRISGYGVAQPGRIWEAVAEVDGTITSIHPSLKSGELIKAGSVLVKIDPTEYQLAIARLTARAEQTQASITELKENEENTRRLLVVEQRSLALSRKSLEREQELSKRKAVSLDQVDREERIFLQQKQNVQRLENSLSLFPAKQRALQAALAVHQSELEQAGIDLSKTVISAPYDCRLGDVTIQAGQYVRTGQSLFKAHGTAVTEIETRFRIENLRRLLGGKKDKQYRPGLRTESFKQLFRDIGVIVTLQSGDWNAQWEARIDRLREGVDFKTREIKVVVAIDRPYDKAIPGVRPPLSEGVFCRVELQAQVRAGSVIVPTASIHDGHVFIVDTEQRLQKKPVLVDFSQSDFVVIKAGLSGKEMVVVSDPTPAIIGMKVSPVVDRELRQQLRRSAQEKRVTQ